MGRGAAYSRYYREYGAPGSMADRAGGMSVLEARREGQEQEQRKQKLVDVFSFSKSSSAKYGCDNGMVPLAQIIREFGDTVLYPSTDYENEFVADGNGDPVSPPWKQVRAITLREGRLVNATLWPSKATIAKAR